MIAEPPRADSLVAQLWQAVRGRPARSPRPAPRGRGGYRHWIVPGLVAFLIAAIPAVTWAGAAWLVRQTHNDNADLAERAAPRLAAHREVVRSRRLLQTALARPVAPTLDAIAAVLPGDARLDRLAIGADGSVTLRVATADPDRVRAALRRAPGLARLRDVTQRRGDGVMLVTMRSGA